MNFDATLFPLSLLAAFGLPTGLWLGWALYRTPWRDLLTTALWHRWAGGVLLIAILWRLHGPLGMGLDLHLLGSTLATLCYGLPVGSLCVALGAIIATATAEHTSWAALPLNLLTEGLLPALVTLGVRQLSTRHLPANYFIFLFIDTCLSAALGIVAVGIIGTALIARFGQLPLDWLLGNYLPYYILMAFSEAWLTGAAIALMVVWLPGWVASFDDRVYLRKPRH